MMKEYSIGLDIGSSSVGFVAVESRRPTVLLKKKKMIAPKIAWICILLLSVLTVFLKAEVHLTLNLDIGIWIYIFVIRNFRKHKISIVHPVI